MSNRSFFARRAIGAIIIGALTFLGGCGSSTEDPGLTISGGLPGTLPTVTAQSTPPPPPPSPPTTSTATPSGPARSLFVPAVANARVLGRTVEGFTESRLVQIDESALPGGVGMGRSQQLELTFGQDTVNVTMGPAEPLGKGDMLWKGTVDGAKDSVVILTRSGDSYYGRISSDGENFGFESAGPGGLLLVGAVAEDKMPVCGVGQIDQNESHLASAPTPDQADPAAAVVPLDGTINVGFLYTAAAANRIGSLSQVRALAHACLAYANLGLINNRQRFRFRLVDVAPVDYVEVPGRLVTDLYNISEGVNGLSAVHPNVASEVSYLMSAGADEICLFAFDVPRGGGNYTAGIAWLSGVTPGAARLVCNVYSTGLLRNTAHELGHTMGVHHDAATDNYEPITPAYARGFITPGKRGDIMSYAQLLTGAMEIPCYSDSTLLDGGELMGNASSADGARRMREIWSQIADNSTNNVPSYAVSLGIGWNLISLGFSDPLTGSFQLDNPGAITACWSFDSATSQYEPETFTLDALSAGGDIDKWRKNLCKGFWVYSNVPQTLRIDGYSWYGSGLQSGVPADFVPGVALNPGWNLLGVPAPDSVLVETLDIGGISLPALFAQNPNSPPVNKTAYSYANATSAYALRDLSVANAALDGFKGYWVYANASSFMLYHPSAVLKN